MRRRGEAESRGSGASSPGLELLRWEEWRRFRAKRVKDHVDLVKGLEASLKRINCVLLAVLHGSVLETSEPRDVDVAVYLDPRCSPTVLLDVIAAVEDSTGLPGDVQLLNDAPPGFVARVLEEGVVLLERLPGLAAKLYLKAIDELEFARLEGGWAARQLRA